MSSAGYPLNGSSESEVAVASSNNLCAGVADKCSSSSDGLFSGRGAPATDLSATWVDCSLLLVAELLTLSDAKFATCTSSSAIPTAGAGKQRLRDRASALEFSFPAR